jgi:formate dehydrogenase assembly factor FdhD
MEVIGAIPIVDEPMSFTSRRYVRSASTPMLVENAVQAESLLAVYVNDILTMQLVCSASHLVELVVGRIP